MISRTSNSHRRVTNPRPAPRPPVKARPGARVLEDLTAREQELARREREVAEKEAQLLAAAPSVVQLADQQKFPNWFFLNLGGKPRFMSRKHAEWIAANIDAIRKAFN